MGSFAFYYALQILINAFLLSFYSVMTFIHHQDCQSPSGSNVTPIVTATFYIGFVVHCINFVVNTYKEPI